MTAWAELESIMLSEISQVVKDKYHMISPISGTSSTKQTCEQNRNKDMEIKNKQTVTRVGVGDNDRKKGESQGTYIKDTCTKTTEGALNV